MGMCRKIAVGLGIILWVGAMSPEIFVAMGKGCIFDSEGTELHGDEGEGFLEALFYQDTPIDVNYRFALVDILGGIGKK